MEEFGLQHQISTICVVDTQLDHQYIKTSRAEVALNCGLLSNSVTQSLVNEGEAMLETLRLNSGQGESLRLIRIPKILKKPNGQ